MYVEAGAAPRGRRLEKLKRFLASCALDWDDGIEYSVCAFDEDDEIIASGSLDGATLKCIAVSPLHRGEDLTAAVMTALIREAFDRGRRHLMLYTKPGNAPLFTPFGFSTIVRTADCLLMENDRGGVDRFAEALAPYARGRTGCVVMHCDPMTNGHLHLIRTAAAVCDFLHVFILSEDKGRFPAEERIRIVREACAELPNVRVSPTGPYMISAATFPSYFIRDKVRVDDIRCAADIAVFTEKIAPAAGITVRFVGTEPLSPTTNAYNEALKRALPGRGIELVEIERLTCGGESVSASRVRALFDAGDMESIRPLVPDPTFSYLCGLLKGD